MSPAQYRYAPLDPLVHRLTFPLHDLLLPEAEPPTVVPLPTPNPMGTKAAATSCTPLSVAKRLN